MLLRFELDVGYGRVGGAHDIKSFEFDSLRMCISSLFQRLPARLDHHIVQSVSQRKLSLSLNSKQASLGVSLNSKAIRHRGFGYLNF
jgi:hypothetical protein